MMSINLVFQATCICSVFQERKFWRTETSSSKSSQSWLTFADHISGGGAPRHIPGLVCFFKTYPKKDAELAGLVWVYNQIQLHLKTSIRNGCSTWCETNLRLMFYCARLQFSFSGASMVSPILFQDPCRLYLQKWIALTTRRCNKTTNDATKSMPQDYITITTKKNVIGFTPWCIIFVKLHNIFNVYFCSIFHHTNIYAKWSNIYHETTWHFLVSPQTR